MKRTHIVTEMYKGYKCKVRPSEGNTKKFKKRSYAKKHLVSGFV